MKLGEISLKLNKEKETSAKLKKSYTLAKDDVEKLQEIVRKLQDDIKTKENGLTNGLLMKDV